jgi:hypothetical protein
MREFVLGVVMNILRHVRVERYKEVSVGLVAASAWDFVVLDSTELVVLLPQIGFKDFERRKKAQNIYVAVCRPVVEVVVLSCMGYQCGPDDSPGPQVRRAGTNGV